MGELFKIKGKFQSFEEKQITPTFTKRIATFSIDNTYGDGKGRIEDVPFEVFGKSLDTAKTLSANQEAEIKFGIGGKNGFSKLSAAIITPGKESNDIPF